MRPTSHALALTAVVFVFASVLGGGACSSSNNDKHDGSIDSPPAGSGGHKATGGAAGSATGGNLGSGGRVTGGAGGGGAIGSGGAPTVGGTVGTGGAPAVGGATGTGGAPRIDGGVGTGGLFGTGGRATGGATGSGGTAAIDAARPDGAADQVRVDTQVTADAPPDVLWEPELDGLADLAQADGPPDAPSNADTTLADVGSPVTLESCFVGLPAQVGVQMIATKSTADGRVRLRIALDTEDRGGTSGTLGWGLIRLAVEVDGDVACITDRSALRYTGSHHNCSDTATGKAGTTTYSLAAPDRATATLTIESNGSSVGPYTLTDTACAMWWSAGAQITCRSGGPC